MSKVKFTPFHHSRKTKKEGLEPKANLLLQTSFQIKLPEMSVSTWVHRRCWSPGGTHNVDNFCYSNFMVKRLTRSSFCHLLHRLPGNARCMWSTPQHLLPTLHDVPVGGKKNLPTNSRPVRTRFACHHANSLQPCHAKLHVSHHPAESAPKPAYPGTRAARKAERRAARGPPQICF